MKGTLFSADFIKDSSDTLRLLELNTDTAIVPEQIDDVNWTPFINTLTSQNISDLHVIYKPVIHNELVNALSSSFASVSGSTFTKYTEDRNTIYPTTVVDSSDKFILRLAYDESAIFDSEYCKGRLNTYKLFYTGSGGTSETGSISEFYYSSSNEEYDSLTKEINGNNVPDAAIKDIDETNNPIDFHKIGSSSLDSAARWNGFIAENKASDKLIEQYHFHNSSLDGDNRVTSHRAFYIVWGPDLEQIHLHSYVNSALFDVSTNLTTGIDDTSFSNKIDDYHFYEYATNAPKLDGSGLLSTDKIQKSDDTYIALSDIQVGDVIKSFFISGSPTTENDETIMNWSHAGSTLPSGSYVTSSEVVFKNTETLSYNTLVEYVVDGDSIFSGTSKQFLVYDSGSNQIKYKQPLELNATNDYFFKLDGTLVDLDEVNYYITSDSNIQVVEVDVEDTDTYILSGSTAFNAVVSHNAPCFVAGTSISMANDTTKNIEDVVIGDLVKSYNFTTNKVEGRSVQGISQKEVNVTITITFDDTTSVRCTQDHPLYSVEHGWASLTPNFSKEKYGLDVAKLEAGQTIQDIDGNTKTISTIETVNETVMVYNLINISGNHNYYANNALAHNRCFDFNSPVEMWDGTIKVIGEIKVGDEVKSYKDNEFVKGIVTEVLTHPTEEVVDVVKLDNMIAEPNHPVLVNGKWTTFDKVGEVEQMYVTNWYNLEIDGNNVEGSEHNFIIDGYIVSGLGDSKELNSRFMRQSEELLKNIVG